MRFLDNLIDRISYLGAMLGVIIIIFLTLIITLNVILRYGFNVGLVFVEEYSGYLYIAIVYLGFAYAAIREAHIKVELAVRYVPPRIRAVLDTLTLLISLGLMIVYLRFVWSLFATNLISQQKAETIVGTPLWIPQTAMVVGLVMFIMAIAAGIVRILPSLKQASKNIQN